MLTDVTDRAGAVLLGLPDFVVLAAGEVAGEVELLVETTAAVTGCPACGVVAEPHGWRPVLVRDLPAGGRPVLLVWSKRLWRCPEPACRQRTWSKTHPQVARRAVLTERARSWAMRRVGQHCETVAGVARQLGVGWHTVMRAVRDYGRPLVDDPGRLDGVTALGVDEHVWSHAGPGRPTWCATGIVDLPLAAAARRAARAHRHGVRRLAGRAGGRLGQQVRVAALDPFRGYPTALPGAVRVLDAFHVVKLGNTMVDEVRRRVQQQTRGHRGYKTDPLYRGRRLLRRGVETRTDRQLARIDAARAAGDPHDEAALAWQCAQLLRAVYHAPNPDIGRRHAVRVLDTLPGCPIDEIARLGRTLRVWRVEFLAYHDTHGASNGPTEALNLLVERTRRTAHSFRNFDNYRLRLLLSHGVRWQTPPVAQIRTRRPRFVA